MVSAAGGVSDKQDSGVVARYYVDWTKQPGGAARVARADCGTENIYVAATQCFLRSQHNLGGL